MIGFVCYTYSSIYVLVCIEQTEKPRFGFFILLESTVQLGQIFEYNLKIQKTNIQILNYYYLNQNCSSPSFKVKYICSRPYTLLRVYLVLL